MSLYIIIIGNFPILVIWVWEGGRGEEVRKRDGLRSEGEKGREEGWEEERKRK